MTWEVSQGDDVPAYAAALNAAVRVVVEGAERIDAARHQGPSRPPALNTLRAQIRRVRCFCVCSPDTAS